MQQTRVYRRHEETANTLTHLIGLVLSFLGAFLLFKDRSTSLEPREFYALLFFSISLILLYLTSTLYHAAQTQKTKRILKYWDHAAIFLLIAGTYTPFCLFGAAASKSQNLILSVWSLALFGIIIKVFFVGRFRGLSTILYLLMGWLVVMNLELLEAMPGGQFQLLLAGGLSYSLGTIFYMWRSLPFHHMIWHLFVLGGSICHFLSIYMYLVLRT